MRDKRQTNGVEEKKGRKEERKQKKWRVGVGSFLVYRVCSIGLISHNHTFWVQAWQRTGASLGLWGYKPQPWQRRNAPSSASTASYCPLKAAIIILSFRAPRWTRRQDYYLSFSFYHLSPSTRLSMSTYLSYMVVCIPYYQHICFSVTDPFFSRQKTRIRHNAAPLTHPWHKRFIMCVFVFVFQNTRDRCVARSFWSWRPIRNAPHTSCWDVQMGTDAHCTPQTQRMYGMRCVCVQCASSSQRMTRQTPNFKCKSDGFLNSIVHKYSHPPHPLFYY